MGREIRRVPPNWKHPVTRDEFGRERLQPMYDKTYADAAAEWKEGFSDWEAGKDPDRTRYLRDDGTPQEYWEWCGNPPDSQYYRPWPNEEATWFQLWETVSEGTPVTPPFETLQGLADYLAANGDEWDQKRCQEPDWERLWGGIPGVSGWGKTRADQFVASQGWAPSMVMANGRCITNPADIVAELSGN